MFEAIEIQLSGPLDASIRPPGSKSLTNRALACAALANGRSTLRGALWSEDTLAMAHALRALGISVEEDRSQRVLRVEGCGGVVPDGQVDLFVENSGTSIRFLTSLVALGKGTYRLDGIARMRERPIGDLLDALNALGANTQSELGTGCPPVVVHGCGLNGGRATIAANISSQFLSGLLMAAPGATTDVELQVKGRLVSQPYVTMTLEVMKSFGIDFQTADDLSHFQICAPQQYQAITYNIEPDASAASYFWAAAAICGGKVRVEGLSRDALQGDVAFCECLTQMGCQIQYEPNGIVVEGGKLRGIDVDMNAISDTVQTLAAVALFAEGPTRVRGVAHNRHKETDRIGDLACELRKLGATVDEFEDGLCITPGKLKGAEIETYNDHRMAMSLALVGLRVSGVRILNPICTQKTYPEFFDDLQKCCVIG